jgi:hypothetical protein
MTCSTTAPAPRSHPGIAVEVTHAHLPIGMRIDRLRSHASATVRPTRSRLPSLLAGATAVPALGVTALATLILRDRRRAAG